VGRSGSRRHGISSLRGPVETPGAEPGRLVVPLLLNERPILGHILESLESLENRIQGNLILAGEFFGGERIRTMDGLVGGRKGVRNRCSALFCSRASS